MKLDKNPETIKNMFDNISVSYDFFNNLMSLGTHYFIKKDCVKALGIKKGNRVLDLCSGTGDLSEIINKNYLGIEIVGADFSDKMLDIARKRNPDIKYIQCDALNLPFENNSFDFVVVGFGLRNVFDFSKSAEEIYRVLNNGGKFMHLDFGCKNIFSKIFDILVIFLSKLSGKNSKAYEYLINSKKDFPKPEVLIKEFESKGFLFEKRKDYLFGIISCQVMVKKKLGSMEI